MTDSAASDPAVTDPAVTDNATASRYELHLDGEQAAFADYRDRGDVVDFPHTVVDPARRGQGLGARIVKAALDDTRAKGKKVNPICWYVAQYIDENPEYEDLRV